MQVSSAAPTGGGGRRALNASGNLISVAWLRCKGMGIVTIDCANSDCVRAVRAGLLALTVWSGVASGITLDQSALSATGSGGLISNADQWNFTSSSLIVPTNAFGGFHELGVLKVTSFSDGQAQPIVSDIGSTYGIYAVFNLFGHAAPVPGTPDTAILFTSGDVKLYADRNNDSLVDLYVDPGTLDVAVSRVSVGDDRIIADNLGNRITGQTLLQPSALGIPGLLDALSSVGFASWISNSFGLTVLNGEPFPDQVQLDSATLGPILPVGVNSVGDFILGVNEAGVLSFPVPEPDSLSLAMLGGVITAKFARRQRRVVVVN